MSVASQCHGDFHYSKSNAEDAEKDFQRREQDFPQLIGQVTFKQVKGRIKLLLLFHLIDLHLRNAAYTNSSQHDTYTALQKAFVPCLGEILCPMTDPAYLQEFCDFMDDGWTMFGIQPEEDEFLTSDNPVLMFYVNGVISCIFAPLSPRSAVVTFDHTVLRLNSSTIPLDDVMLLNANQAMHSLSAVYSQNELDESEKTAAQKWFAKRGSLGYPGGTITDDKVRLYGFDFSNRLSFLQAI